MATTCRQTTTRADQARRLANAVARSIGNVPDEAGVGARARVLRKLCGHLFALADEVGGCGSRDCMGRPIDGVRFWIPQDRHAIEVGRSERLAAENQRLRAALTAIAEDSHIEEDDWVGRVFGDPAARERHLRDIAASALHEVRPEQEHRRAA